ncbi:MAG: adenine methyltransferase [Bacteroidetes bacterium]|jgi:adenine-specific DNA-methyltransferase|nr:adenine methyltransferase [Bacteroidota bacterium]
MMSRTESRIAKTTMTEIDFKSFPTTRYQGSKRKILPWLHEHTKNLEFNTVLDAFGGSGSVSYLFKKMGKSVTYNDKLKFNSIIGKAIIENQNVTFLKEDLENLKEWIKSNDYNDFIEKTFKGIYYLPKENKWLDGINNGIINMNHYRGKTLEYKKSMTYYALFQACLIKRPYNLFHRNNLSMRTADVERNFGNKVTWEKSFKMYFEKFILEANKLVFDSQTPCFSLNKSVFDLDNVDYDLVYLDPPYLNKKETNETTNYLKCYHFLEGLANYNKWEKLIDFNSANLRFKNIDKGNHFRRENVTETFEELIKKFQNSTIVLSYKSGGNPSIDTLVRIMKKYKKNVYTRSIPYVYALKRPGTDIKKSREVLIFGI